MKVSIGFHGILTVDIYIRISLESEQFDLSSNSEVIVPSRPEVMIVVRHKILIEIVEFFEWETLSIGHAADHGLLRTDVAHPDHLF